MTADNPSLPVFRRSPPRPLETAERAALVRLADALMPPVDLAPASGLDGYARCLDRALAARADGFPTVVALATELADVPEAELTDALRALADRDPDGFGVLSAVLAGAYLMAPEVAGTSATRASGGTRPGSTRRPSRSWTGSSTRSSPAARSTPRRAERAPGKGILGASPARATIGSLRSPDISDPRPISEKCAFYRP